MDNRIDLKFKDLRNRNQKAFIGFLTAGDPNLETSYETIKEMIENGLDILEIGIPFSDPMAEGPTIQMASVRALESNTTTDDVFALAKRVRDDFDIPVILMLYMNLIYKYGIEKFMENSKSAGIDGLIIPDLPLEEVGDLKEFANKEGIYVINLVAPTTKEERIKKIADESEGFIYCVSSLGVTGTRKAITTDLEKFYDRLRKVTELPLSLGFGLSSKEQINNLKGDWDGYIIGSAIVNIIAEHGRKAPAHVGDFVKKLKE